MTVSGSGSRSKSIPDEDFLAVYNDTGRYPSLADVALALGCAHQTVRNLSVVLRKKLAAAGRAQEMVDRKALAAYKPTPQTISPREHANRRATALEADVRALMQAPDRPVVNPQAVVVESHVSTRYDRVSGRRTEAEGTPRIWLTETLKVDPVADPRNRRFLLSGAQNDTPVDRPFWANLTAYAAWLDAEIVIGPWTYETSWWSENDPASRAYDPLIARHLCFGRLEIGPDFAFAGEMNTLPTATKPISDLAAYARGKWTVFPHAKVQLMSVPSVDPMAQAFQVMTTGAVTRPRVVPRKAGVKSLDSHQLGAILVEFDAEGRLFCRQLLADAEGAFQDLDRLVENGRVSTGHHVRALVAADIHTAKLDPVSALATLGLHPDGYRAKGSILEALKPDVLVLHDLHDHESRNHHAKDDLSHKLEMAVRGRDSVEQEVARAARLLSMLARDGLEVVVVESNHDLALERWVREGRYREDGINLAYGLRLDMAYHAWRAEAARALELRRPVPEFSLTEWALRDAGQGAGLDHVSFVHDGRSRLIDGVQVGFHGFRGSNGAKGTVAGYARLGRPITIGDKHSPSIMDGVYGAGVMQLQHGYNKGPSGWAVSHVIQYPNGHRAIVTLQDGRWRAD